MKGYELCLIFQPDTSDAAIDELFTALGAVIAKHNGTVLKTEKWGKRNLKYAIKKQNKGNYCFLYFSGSGDTLKELDRTARYNEQILRYTTIKLDEKFSLQTMENPAAEAVAPASAAPVGEAEQPAETTPGA